MLEQCAVSSPQATAWIYVPLAYKGWEQLTMASGSTPTTAYFPFKLLASVIYGTPKQ